MKRFIRFLALLLTAAMAMSVTAFANAAPVEWEGGAAIPGVIAVDEDCPIQVEREVLIFDLSEFPELDMNDEADLSGYTGSVTAEYTFYNPSDVTVTTRLLFPLGTVPYYASEDYRLDTEKYSVTLGGAMVKTVLRHSYGDLERFDLEDSLSRLSDGYRSDDLYYPEQTVTKVTVEIPDAQPGMYAEFFFNEDTSKTMVYMEDSSWGLNTERNMPWVGKQICTEREKLELYIVGELPEDLTNWRVYSLDEDRNQQELDVDVRVTDTQTMTFLDFTLMEYDPTGEVSRNDWYNAVVRVMEDENTFYGSLSGQFDLDVSGSLQQWYEYTITLGPGERLINTVSAPIYPAINGWYSPSVYGYTYLLSPAQEWAAFGELQIQINTPFYLTKSTVDGFEKTGSGYSVTLDGLPEGELEFALCKEGNPQNQNETYLKKFLWCILRDVMKYLVVPAAVLIGIITFLYRLRKKQK